MRDHYVAGALSTCLVTDHSMLCLFDSELFLDDGMQRKSEFCLAFLVNCLFTLVSRLEQTQLLQVRAWDLRMKLECFGVLMVKILYPT